MTGEAGGATGRFEGNRGGRATGWAWRPRDPGRRLSVEIVVDGSVVAEGAADLARHDLRDAGIGDGAHGFAIDLPSALADGREHTIAARIVGGSQLLPVADDFQVSAAGDDRDDWSTTSFTAQPTAPGDGEGQASTSEILVAAAHSPVAGGVARVVIPAPVGADERIMVVFGRRITRDGAAYLVALGMGLPLSLISVAVTTRYLTPADFGRLSVLFITSGFLTVVYNLVSLQGSLMWAVGGADEDGGGDIMEDLDRPLPNNRRRALGSGLTLSILIVAAGTGAVIALSAPASSALLGSPRFSSAVRWAALSAGCGALWRFAVNVLREERHPYLFAVMFSGRAILALALSVPLLVAGYGINGVLAATAFGALLAGVAAIIVNRRAFALALDPNDVRQIMKLGRRVVPVILGVWLIHNIDLLALSRYASPAATGVYRVAARLGQFPSYVVSAFLMALAPLFRTSLLRAAQDRHGFQEVIAALFSYFVFIQLSIVVALALGADLLVHVAAASYRDAAPLIPLIGLGFVLYGSFYFLARYARIANKMRWFGGTAIVSSGVIGATAMLLIPRLEAFGAALSLIIGMACATGVFLVLIARSAEPVPFQWVRLGLATACAVASFLAGTLNGLSGRPHATVEVALIVAYPFVLVVTGIVPRHNFRSLLLVLRSALPQRPAPEFIARLVDLKPTERVLLERIARRGEDYQVVASDLSLSSARALGRTVRSLRLLAGEPAATAQDARIGRAILGHGPHIESDFLIRRLWTEGVDPLDIHHLETALANVRRVSSRVWTEGGDGPRRRRADAHRRGRGGRPKTGLSEGGSS